MEWTPAELKKAHAKLGLTAATLAKALRTSARTVQSWEDESGGKSARAIPGPAQVLLELALASRQARKLLGLAAELEKIDD